MKKSFLKGASIFLASVLTVGMCSAYSVNAKVLYLMRGISEVWKPEVMWKSVRRAASRSSQYSLLDSSQSMRPYLKAKKATAR